MLQKLPVAKEVETGVEEEEKEEEGSPPGGDRELCTRHRSGSHGRENACLEPSRVFTRASLAKD